MRLFVKLMIGVVIFLSLVLCGVFLVLYIINVRSHAYKKGDSYIQNQVTEMILTFDLRSDYKNELIRRIIDLGPEAIPPVLDLLFDRGNFKGRSSPSLALQILGSTKDPSLLPSLLQKSLSHWAR